MIYRVYVLFDSGNPEQVRYVGMTRQSLAVRLQGHLITPSNPNTAAWFVEARQCNLEIQIRELSQHTTATEAAKAERQHIAQYRASGGLLNVATGGYSHKAKESIVFTPEMEAALADLQDVIAGGPERRMSEALEFKLAKLALVVWEKFGSAVK